MKVALMTSYYSNYRLLADAVFPNWNEYCERHGYDSLYYCRQYKGVGGIGFEKMAWIYDVLFGNINNWDLVFYCDLDIFFTNLTIGIETLVDNEHSYFATTGFNLLCNGTFLIKKTEGGKEVLKYILENKYGHDNEQDTMARHLEEPVLKKHLKLYPYTSFGSFLLELYPYHGEPTREKGNWEKGDLLVHLAGLSLDKRLDIIKTLQNKVIR